MISAIMLLLIAINSGVVIVDNVLFYGDDHKMRLLRTGDMVDILQHADERVTVAYDSAVGELDRNVLIDFDSEIAEDEQFVFARGYFDEGEYSKAMRLFDIFVKYFDDSQYLPEAMYYLGQSYEALATKGMDDSLPGILLNDKIDQRFYNGDIYQLLVQMFPDNTYAAKAEYRLINLFRIAHLPWDDSIEIIQKELIMWQEFSTKYEDTDEYMLAQSEMGYLNRVLYEITAATDFRDEAIRLFSLIVSSYPNTIHAAYANVHLHELEQGKKIYKY
jgi:tetratricopeptide (TPR) repeat protein